MDAAVTTPKPRPALYQHLKAAGSMGRKNPELVRLAKVTGLSVEHLFQLALGRRVPSLLAARAIARAVPRGSQVTEHSFFVDPQE